MTGGSGSGADSWGTDRAEHRKVRHNLAERRRTNRINKLFNQLYEVLISPEVLPILNEAGPNGQLRKLPRKSKAAVLEAAQADMVVVVLRDLSESQQRMDESAPRKAMFSSVLFFLPFAFLLSFVRVYFSYLFH